MAGRQEEILMIEPVAITNATWQIRVIDGNGMGLNWTEMVLINTGLNDLTWGRTAAGAPTGVTLNPGIPYTIRRHPDAGMPGDIFVDEAGVGATVLEGHVIVDVSNLHSFLMPAFAAAANVINPGI